MNIVQYNYYTLFNEQKEVNGGKEISLVVYRKYFCVLNLCGDGSSLCGDRSACAVIDRVCAVTDQPVR